MNVYSLASSRRNLPGAVLCCVALYCFVFALGQTLVTQPVSAQTTSITIQTEPEADVYLGKTFLGRSPMSAILQHNNTVVIEVRADGFATTTRTLEVRPGIDPNVFIQLEPAVGTAQLVDLPRGTQVWLNNTPLRTPETAFQIQGPATQIAIKLPNQRVTRQVLAAADAQHLNLALISHSNDYGALWRSALIPGWGQYYNRRTTGKSLVFAGLALIGGGATIQAQAQYRQAQADHDAARELFENGSDEQSVFQRRLAYLAAVDERDTKQSIRNRFILALAGVYFINLLDVYVQHTKVPALGILSTDKVTAIPYISPAIHSPAVGFTLTF